MVWANSRYPWDMTDLFTDRENIRHPHPVTAVDDTTWHAALTMVWRRIDDGSLGYRFPLLCDDTPIPAGTAEADFFDYMAGHVPGVINRLRHDNPHAPPTGAVLDFLELVADSVARPVQIAHHDYQRHFHLRFDREAGLAEFVQEVNRLFRRAGLQFEMNFAGRFQRIGPPLMHQLVRSADFFTEDNVLNGLLQEACTRIFSRNAGDNRAGLERLWDGFERTKTLEPGATKPAQISALLTKAAANTGPHFLAVLEAEAQALNHIGNNFQIRHYDQRAEAMPRPEQVDALFFRLFSFLHYVLAATGRAR